MAKRRIIALALLFCLGLPRVPCTAQAASTSDAAEPIVPGTACTLTLSYRHGGTAFSNVPVRLYRVADLSASAQYTLSTSFRTTGLELNGIRSSKEWDVARATFESYILANTINADWAGETDRDGQAVFEMLTPGLYLVSDARAVQNGLICSFDSALISLPGLGEDGQWQYRITVAPKARAIPLPGPGPDAPDKPDTPGKDVQYRLLKLWKDENHREKRPGSVEVELFRDGASVRTVRLSEETNWSYSWTAEDDGADWMAVERNVPYGYTVTVEEQGTSFILTNVLRTETPPGGEVPGEEPPGEEPPGEEPPGEEPPGEEPPAEEPGTEVPPGDGPTADNPKTGDTTHVLLYAVLMHVSGIALILLGLAGKKKRV